MFELVTYQAKLTMIFLYGISHEANVALLALCYIAYACYFGYLYIYFSSFTHPFLL